MKLYLIESIRVDMVDYLIKGKVPKQRAEELVDSFELFKKKGLIKDTADKDLQQWMKRPYDDFVDFVVNLRGKKTKSEVKKEIKSDGAELVFEDDNWRIYLMTTHAAVRQLGAGTKWCITQEDSAYWEEYSEYSTFYFLISKTETIQTSPKWYKIAAQVTWDGGQFWDAGDKDHLSLPNKINPPKFEYKILAPEVVIKGNTVVDCSNKDIGEYTVPDGITAIGFAAFRQCERLTKVGLPNSLTQIENNAFGSCRRLREMTIPESVNFIGKWAFKDCSSLEKIKLHSQLTQISNGLCKGCVSLNEITIPDSVTSIGNYAFSDCSRLTSVMMGSGVASIGIYAFSGCGKLTSIKLPGSVTSIGDGVFYGCLKLKTIYCEVEEQPAGWNKDWNGSGAEVIWGYKKKKEEMKRSNSIKKLGESSTSIIPGYEKEELIEIVMQYIKDTLEQSGIEEDEVEIQGIRLWGSRVKGKARKNSDLDVLVEYTGTMREDDLFSVLTTDPLYIGGVVVDFNPTKAEKSGTIRMHMEED